MASPRILFGESTIELALPPDREATVLEPSPPGRPRPVEEAVAPLREVIVEEARGAATVALLIPDDSRPFPAARLLPWLLDALLEAGVPPDGIRGIVATGLHRAMPPDALRSHLGPGLLDRIPVRNHDARDPGTLVARGEIAPGVPLLLARDAVEADLRVLLASFEPHQYHGFSGGWKVLGIGCAGEATIAYTHGRTFLADDRVRPGAGRVNPFRAAVAEAGRRAGRAVALNVIPGPEPGTTWGAAAGDPDDVWWGLAGRAVQVFGARVDEPADVVLTGVPAPKSRSLYQASRAATNLILAERPVLRPGGTLVLAAPCEDGVGTGEGERRFAEALRTRGDAILDGEEPLRPGEQRAWMVARVRRDHRIVVAGARRPEALAGLGLTLVEDPAAVAAAIPGRLVVVPDGLHVLPSGSPFSLFREGAALESPD